jgi:lysophospholipase L1-like esterase
MKTRFFLKVLIISNIISLSFLIVVSSYYKVPKNLLIKLKIIEKNILNDNYTVRNSIFSSYPSKHYRIVMLGDSITEWVAWNELFGISSIANRGIRGDTTSGLLNRLESIYNMEPDICFIMIGINDILKKTGDTEHIIKNIEKIVNELIKNEINPIVQSILYVSDERQNWRKINKEVDMINSALKSICVERGVLFIDVNKILSTNEMLKKEYTYDGVHLSGLGYKEWGKLLLPIVTKDD